MYIRIYLLKGNIIKLKFIPIMLITASISLSLHAMEAAEAVQTNNEAARNWATQLCTQSFLHKAYNASFWMLVSGDEPSFDTNNLTEEEKKLLAKLVEHNEWSSLLYLKIHEYFLTTRESKPIYAQIIFWAFGEASSEFNYKVPKFSYTVSKTNRSLELEEILPQFAFEHINLYGANGKPFLFRMLKIPDSGLLSKFLEVGANPNAQCAITGNSVLHELSNTQYYRESFQNKKTQQHYRNIIPLFSQFINARNNLGRTPLHGAIGNINFMKVLLEREDVQIDAQDVDGNTPLHLAADFFDPEKYRWDHPLRKNHDIHIERKNDKFGTLLLLYGANPEIMNNQGLCYDDIIQEKKEKFKFKYQK